MQIVVHLNDLSYSEKHYSDIEEMCNRILIDYSNVLCDCFIIFAGFNSETNEKFNLVSSKEATKESNK